MGNHIQIRERRSVTRNAPYEFESIDHRSATFDEHLTSFFAHPPRLRVAFQRSCELCLKLTQSICNPVCAEITQHRGIIFGSQSSQISIGNCVRKPCGFVNSCCTGLFQCRGYVFWSAAYPMLKHWITVLRSVPILRFV
jgi:hypothetical protein